MLGGPGGGRLLAPGGRAAPDAFIVTGLGKADLIGPDPEVRALVAAWSGLQAEPRRPPPGSPARSPRSTWTGSGGSAWY